MSYCFDNVYGSTGYRKVFSDPQRNVSRSSGSIASSGFHSQVWSRGSTSSYRRGGVGGYSQISSTDSLESFNGDVKSRNEKEMLQALNDRFASYIDKVRHLELQNKNLEEEAVALRQSQAGRSAIGELYEREIGDLRSMVLQLSNEKTQVMLEQEHIEEDAQHLKQRLDDEARNREELEAAIRTMTKYTDDAGLARLELDKKLQSLTEEAAFLKKNHEEEIADLLCQTQGPQMQFEVRDALKADVTSALREIRAQLDGHASKSAMQAEEWFKVRVDKLSEASRFNTDAIRSAQSEIGEYRRQLQSRTIELETLKGTRDSLERQRCEIEDRHHGDVSSLQETIRQLDNELKNIKWEMASQLRDYQDLLNVKMALDIEIAAYRKLLEGEETRFTSSLGPYSYIDSTPKISHIKIKADEISDAVILEEQTDETQVTEEVTENGEARTKEEDEEEGEGEKEEDKEEEKETKLKVEDEDVVEADKEGEEKNGGEEVEEEPEADAKSLGGEEQADKPKQPGKKAASPDSKSPAKSPQPKSPRVKSPETKSPAKTPQPKSPESKSPPTKSPTVKSPESKSPPTKSPTVKSPEPKSPVKKPAEAKPFTVKSPADKSPESKSPAGKSPQSKSPGHTTPESKSPTPKSPVKKSSESLGDDKFPVEDKPKPATAKDAAKPEKESKPKEQSQPSKEDKDKEPEVKLEEKPEIKTKEKVEEKTEKEDDKKDSKTEDSLKKAETPKVPSKPAEEKPSPKATSEKEHVPTKKEEEKPAPPKPEEKVAKTTEKPKAEVKPAEKDVSEQKLETEKEKKPEPKKEVQPEVEVKKEKEAPKAATKETSDSKTEKVEKSSSTDAKETKITDEKSKK